MPVLPNIDGKFVQCDKVHMHTSCTHFMWYFKVHGTLVHKSRSMSNWINKRKEWWLDHNLLCSPPETHSVSAVTYEASSEQRYATAAAISCGVPSRFSRLAVRCCSRNSSFSTSADANLVGTIPATAWKLLDMHDMCISQKIQVYAKMTVKRMKSTACTWTLMHYM